MRKHVSLAILQLLYCSVVFGQTDDPGCNLYVTFSDTSCSTDQTSCSSVTGCTTFNIIVACPGTYYFKAWTACSDTHCGHCASCVSIVRSTGGGLITCETLTTCGQLDCCNECSFVLTQGSYTMYVCKIPCAEADEEACCPTQYGCTAWGIVSSNPISPCQ